MNSPNAELSLAQVQEYLQFIRRDKWWVYLMTVGLTLSAVVGIAVLPNKYKATTTVEVDPQKVPEQFVSELVRVSPGERLQTMSQEVLSATRLQKVIDKWDLYAQMRRTSTSEAVIEQMRSDVEIEVKQSGGGLAVFSITYQGKDPAIVAKVTNQLASDFIEWNLKSREQKASGTTEFLSSQLQEAKKALEEQEDKLRQYKMSHLGELPQQQEALLHTLSGLQAELQANAGNFSRLDEERLTLTELPDSVSMPGGIPQPAASERVRLEMEKNQLETRLSELRRRYTDEFPDVREVVRRLNHVSESLNALPADKPSETSRSTEPTAKGLRLETIAREMQRLKEEQKRIREQIASYQAKVEAIPRREQEMIDLTRNYDISKGRYDSLLSKSYAADMSNQLDTQEKGERFILLDPALVPERPFKPNRLKYMALSFFMSFFGSVAVVILKEYLDPRVKTEREIRVAYPEPILMLAAIPHIQSPTERRKHLRFVAFAVSFSILAIGVVAGLLWKIHPIL
jgi:succinoglycan biosynthesis transport protein ExoP